MSERTPEDRKRLNEALDKMDMPASPVNPMEEAGQGWRACYDLFRAAEFSDAQALYLAAVMITGHPGSPPQH